jgi:hypothetical protein
MLEVERNFLESHRDELLKTYGDRFLVIKGESVSGAFDTMEGALQGAVNIHGLENVLIQKATEPQMTVSIPALTLGILNANFSSSDPSASSIH